MKKVVIALTLLLICFALFVGYRNYSPRSSTPPTATGIETYKDNVVIAFNYAITTGDPQEGGSAHHFMLNLLTHNRLVTYDNVTQTPKPELATGWDWISDTELEFKLRHDVKFQDGTPMTADDVVYTFMKAKTSKAAASQTVVLDKVEAVDNYTVRMTLKEPNVDWLFTLSLPMCSIISKSAVETDSAKGGFIGTGVWSITNLAPNDYVDLIQNNDCWMESPKTKTMSIRYIPEDSARLIALQNDEIDICLNPSNTELDFIKDDARLTLIQYNSTASTYVAFNSSKAPGSDQNLRTALAYCLNLDDIVVVATNSLAKKAVTYWGPYMYGYYEGFGEYGQDIDKAKQYLNKAFPNGGAKLELIVAGSSDRMAAAQVIQEQARVIGLEITIRELETAALNAMTAFNASEHQATIYGLQWNNHGDDSRRPYYPNSNVNKATITNNRIVELIDLAVAEFDNTKRKGMYQEIQQINHDQAYYIPLYYAIQSHGVSKKLSGAVWEANGYHNFTYAHVVAE